MRVRNDPRRLAPEAGKPFARGGEPGFGQCDEAVELGKDAKLWFYRVSHDTGETKQIGCLRCRSWKLSSPSFPAISSDSRCSRVRSSETFRRSGGFWSSCRTGFVTT